MATNRAQRAIRHSRRRSGILVPLLEDLFQRPVEIEDEQDVDFITDLLKSQLVRGEARQNRPVFSPSQLGSCLRYVYLLKNHDDLGIDKTGVFRPDANYYFFSGNWAHLKWQFALHKLDRRINDRSVFSLLGVEVPIISKRKDHGGTVDAICLISGQPYIVDFKGLNVRTFGQIASGEIPAQYVIQLADYGMLFNSQRNGGVGKIFSGLLVSENKGGPDGKHPIALHESEIPIQVNLPKVHNRLEVLRHDSIPAPECTSTGEVQFLGCPFRNYCKKEVAAVQRHRRELDSRDAEDVHVEVPGGSGHRGSHRNSKRR